MNQQLAFGLGDQPQTIELPTLEIAPVTRGIGQIHHVIRLSVTTSIQEIGEIAISPRCKESLYTLSTGERIILTSRKNITRPEGVDGVLQREDNGSLKWQSHSLLDSFHVAVTQKGWAAVARDIAAEWNGKFSFRAEQANEDGTVDPGKEGLRPPQLGALYAIGAHWSLYHQPATIVMPTGTGKTETMLSALAAYVRGPLLVAVPWEILRSQTARKFLTFGLLRKLGALMPDVPNPIVGIVTGRPHSEDDLEIFEQCNVVIGTMSSLAVGSAVDFAPEIARRVNTLIVDEAHHIGADSWTRFRDAFQERKVLQFTATPFRRDGKLVDGQVIYNYPLSMAQKDHYFKNISFEPVYEIDPAQIDTAIATAAIEKLRSDLAAQRNHLLMARCADTARADEVHAIYRTLAPDLNPVLVHSELENTDARVAQLKAGHSRIVVCVNMLGEGFDLPELKVAAVHDMHKSLAVLLQFIGRFTRTAGDNIGDATVVANIADVNVPPALERLYSEDADWNKLLSEFSSDAAREHAELIAFLNSAQRLDEQGDEEGVPISQQLLRPTMSTLIYEAQSFHPKRFHEGLPNGMEVHRVWLHQPSNTLFFVTRAEPSIKWMRSKALKDCEWALFVLHFDAARNLLFLASSDHSSTFEKMAKAVGASRIFSGDVIFRTLGRITRLVFQNVGVKKHGRRNLRYAMYTGADVAEALSISERAGSVKSNLSGTGWENGRPVSIGCSYKGRVWSREQGTIPQFVNWCESVGDKIVDNNINTSEIIANVLIPEELTSLPDTNILGLEWPIELLGQSEERVVFSDVTREQPLSMFDIRFVSSDTGSSTVTFEIVEAGSGAWATFILKIGGEEGFRVTQSTGRTVTIKVGNLEAELAAYLSDYPPMIRFVDLSELDGNLLIRPQNPQELVIADERFEIWPWQGVDITKESIWKDGQERRNSIQWHVAQHFVAGGFDIVFDDDSPGEAADLICLKENDDHIRLALIHCKFSSGAAPGERIKDVVDVCSQAIRSAKWKWRFRDLCRHVTARESKLAIPTRPTRFLAGRPSDLNKFIKISRFKEIRPEIIIVQPGVSKENKTQEQTAVMAAAASYLKETIGADLEIVCSA